ncbi:hypothetical protein H8E77_29605 [bacterium]|nr:hypothetical protein [bacterium]
MPTLLLDSGNLVTEASWLGELQYETAILAMNEMGYDALNIGEQDLFLPPDYLQETERKVSFRILATNIYAQVVGQLGRRSMMQTYQLGDITLKIGITSICSPKFATKVEQVNPYIVFAKALESLEPILKDLRKQVDLIIVLASVEPEEAEKLAEAFPIIDILIVAHGSFPPLDKPTKVGQTIILNSNTASKYLGRLDLTFDTTKKIIHQRHEMIPLTADIPSSTEVLQLLQRHDEKLDSQDLLSIEAERTRFPGGGTFTGSQDCIECHQEAVDLWEKSAHARAYAPIRQHKREYDISCLKCHTTGFGYIGGFRGNEQTPQFAMVGCEGCHGAGSNHLMNNYQDYGEVTEAKCQSCHDAESSPQFNYETALKTIQH